MPATTPKQQRAMQMALAVKAGRLDPDKVSPAIRKLADSLSEEQLRDFTVLKEAAAQAYIRAYTTAQL